MEFSRFATLIWELLLVVSNFHTDLDSIAENQKWGVEKKLRYWNATKAAWILNIGCWTHLRHAQEEHFHLYTTCVSLNCVELCVDLCSLVELHVGTLSLVVLNCGLKAHHLLCESFMLALTLITNIVLNLGKTLQKTDKVEYWIMAFKQKILN